MTVNFQEDDMSRNHPLAALLSSQSFVLLDGAMATELEAHGCNLADSLWSAKVLLEAPEVIRQVHLDYFRAGAQIATTASYQATPAGFAARNLSQAQATELIAKSVQLACQARALYLQENPGAGTLLVAGSVGPYGAYLADGSEYRGDYVCRDEDFQAFHRQRIETLLLSGVDLLACETFPSFPEICALIALLRSWPQARAWFSFSVRDSEHLCDGTPLREVMAAVSGSSQVVSVGVNCLAPERAAAVLRHLRSLTSLPLLVYPNSGERYDPQLKSWHRHASNGPTLVDYLPEWLEAGARLIGGCCRTTPDEIATLRQHLPRWR